MPSDASQTSILSTSDPRLRWTWAALATSVVLVAAKFVVFAVTGSTAALSDALESVINVVTSGFAVFAVWLGARPGDHDHPYGHGRIEDISVAVEGLLILAAGVGIGAMGIQNLIHPPDLHHLDVGVVAFGVIGAVTYGASWLLIGAGRRHTVPALIADGEHLRADAVTTVGVLVGLVLVQVTGIETIDAVVALLIAVWLLFTGSGLVRRAVRGLMDEVDPDRLEGIAAALEAAREPGWLAPHRAKVHRLGARSHVDLHLVAPRYWSLERAHRASDRVERAMRDALGPDTETMVHMEPCTDKNCVRCDVADCPVRADAFTGRVPWTAADIAQVVRRTVPPKPADADAAHGVGSRPG